VNFLRFQAATCISRVNCAKIAGHRPGQPTYEIFSIECKFLQSCRLKEACARRCQRGGTPLKSGYLSTVGLCGVKVVAYRHRHAAYHNKHCWRAS